MSGCPAQGERHGSSLAEKCMRDAKVREIAKLKGHARQSIHEHVEKLEAAGKLLTRRGKGGTRLVNLAEYDFVRGEVTNLPQQQAADTARAAPADSAFNVARTRIAEYEAALKRLEYEKQVGELLRTEDVVRSMEKCTASIVRSLELLPTQTEELVAAMVRAGAMIPSQAAHALRIALRAAINQTRNVIATNLRVLEESDDEPEDP